MNAVRKKKRRLSGERTGGSLERYVSTAIAMPLAGIRKMLQSHTAADSPALPHSQQVVPLQLS